MKLRATVLDAGVSNGGNYVSAGSLTIEGGSLASSHSRGEMGLP